jgi:hypothetical protein
MDAVQELLKNQVIKAVVKNYIPELNQEIQDWNDHTFLNLLTRVRPNYAIMDKIVYNNIMKSFVEPPAIDLPIEKYFITQEECRLLASDSANPITNPEMVLQLTPHMSATGIINISITKFKHQGTPEKT